ncbi:MAG: hypothetical protein IPJ23_03895 [Ignavibacteriales bacterium]|nr:hypothetical protein [Ignavibacteriales bacterium]
MRLSAKWDVGYVNEPLIKVRVERPTDYPKDYTTFSWDRIFLLFDIHSNNINRNNYPNYLQYKLKRFVFRNKVSFEIVNGIGILFIRIKDIRKCYPAGGIKLELFYVNSLLVLSDFV